MSARRAVPLLIALAAAACRREGTAAPDAGVPGRVEADAGIAAASPAEPSSALRELRKLTRDHQEALPPCPAGEGDLLASAATYYDARRFEDALACAAQAAAALPRSADAHSERAAALAALDRLDEARVAYARALAIDPDHADALLGAADLYVSRLPPSREFTELAFEYARRGRLGARKAKNRTLVGQFALLEASALNGLGRNKEALERADEAIQLDPDEAFDARKERTLALWELCRFEEARKAIDGLLAEADDRHRAWAYYHLGLLLERHGRDAESAAAFAKARQLDPEGFPTEPDVPAAEFATLVRAAVDGLPADMQRDLDGIPVTADEIPNTEDLTASDPPLSPTILGLFRGPSKGEDCPPPDDDPGPCRSVAVYRRNLLRVVADRGELARQIRATLIHEIGHLRGEDDVQLAARGLE